MAMCFCFLVFLPGKQSHFSLYNQKFLETLRVLFGYCMNHAILIFVAVTCFLRYSIYEIQDKSLRTSKLTKQLAPGGGCYNRESLRPMDHL